MMSRAPFDALVSTFENFLQGLKPLLYAPLTPGLKSRPPENLRRSSAFLALDSERFDESACPFFPQRLKPLSFVPLLSELKLRPPQNLRPGFAPSSKIVNNAHAGKEKCCEGEYQNNDESRNYRLGRNPEALSQRDKSHKQADSDYATAHRLVSRVAPPRTNEQRFLPPRRNHLSSCLSGSLMAMPSWSSWSGSTGEGDSAMRS